MLRGMKVVASSDDTRFTYFCLFDDIRSTNEAERYIEEAQLNNWAVKYITQTEYAGVADNNANAEKTSYHDGQVIFVASFTGPTTEFKIDGADKTVHDFASGFGELRAFTHITSAAWPNLEFRAEYYSITAAKKMLAAANKDTPMTVEVSDQASLLSTTCSLTDFRTELEDRRQRAAQLYLPGVWYRRQR